MISSVLSMHSLPWLQTANDALLSICSCICVCGFQDLEQRHNTILQMYGEKAEEAEELRLDLEDVKNMYKTQIDELLKNQK